MPKENVVTYAEMLTKSTDELQVELKAAKEELFRLRFQLAIRQLENTARIGEVKHRIAQLSGALRQQELRAGRV
ncbi:MAG: 50S ribosomal protein L29 [Cyanobacteria bacterium NC_groundwater_1444_Ag_S-0.65um_54_12]|nr:50S ribosomal protein L29 [Cyanobacteria bacterium NC_groundwater_1444_Ag_S-0.65um_54_12]